MTPLKPLVLASLASIIGVAAQTGTAQTVAQEVIHPHTVWITPQRRPIPMPAIAGSIELTGVEVTVTVDGRATTTTMEMTVANTSSQPAEGVLLVPVPDGAVVGAFSFDGEGVEPTAKILPASEARRIYDDIVRLAKDPALLEFARWNVLRSSVFPVPAGATQHIQISWDRILPVDGQRIDLALPRSEAIDDVAWKVTVNMKDADEVGTIYSPSHDIVIDRTAGGNVTVTSTVTGTSPFLLSWMQQAEDGGATVFTFPDPTIGGGYFLLLVDMPDIPADRPRDPREVTIVLDRSGSMSGEKMRQARAAAMQVIAGLGPDEAFNIIDYSTTVEAFSPQPVAVSEQSRRDAEAYLASLRPNGGTNIHDALLESIRQPASAHRRSIVLFLTDGLPTVGRTSERAIRDMVEAGNRDDRRIFTFGVGSDVNAPLLDRVATLTRGTSAYVLPNEDVEVKVAGVFKRLGGPVFSDAALTTTTADGTVSTQLVHDLMPMVLPDVFEGEDLILLGKYRGEEPVQFALNGKLMGSPHRFDFQFDLDALATTRHAFVPRLWAGQRIAYLVDEVRQQGASGSLGPRPTTEELLRDPEVAELVEEIVRLSLAHGILTEYTAFLATDGTLAPGLDPVAMRLGSPVAAGTGLYWSQSEEAEGWVFDNSDVDQMTLYCVTELKERAIERRSGEAAVAQALSLDQQKKAGNMTGFNNWYIDGYAKQDAQHAVKQCHDKTFLRKSNVWIDSNLMTRDDKTLVPDQIVSFGTDEWNTVVEELIETNRAAVLALGGPVLLELNNRLVLVCGPDDDC